MPRASTNDTLKLKTKLTKTKKKPAESGHDKDRQQKTGQKDQSDK